jgi:diguanylate cyclase (GGDEF)-like protein
MDKRRHLASDTGLYTYEVFEVLLNYETTRIRRYPSPITLLHVTLAASEYTDDIRSQAHDAMTSLLNRSLRVSDVPAHYHSEFLILLPATDETGARAVAERILASYRTTQSIATGKLSKRRNAYLGLSSHDGSGLISSQQILAEAATAMNEARLRQSYTYLAYSDLANQASV